MFDSALHNSALHNSVDLSQSHYGLAVGTTSAQKDILGVKRRGPAPHRAGTSRRIVIEDMPPTGFAFICTSNQFHFRIRKNRRPLLGKNNYGPYKSHDLIILHQHRETMGLRSDQDFGLVIPKTALGRARLADSEACWMGRRPGVFDGLLKDLMPVVGKFTL
jgi:hypothetical protein